MTHDNTIPDSKRCTKCSKSKTLDMFAKNKTCKDGLSSWCKDCTRIYRAQNRERLNIQNQAWRQANPERVYRESKETVSKRNRRWREANKEKHLENGRAWRRANRLRHHELTRKWKEANPERVKLTERAYKIKNADKQKQQNQLWRDANRTRIRETSRAYRDANRERIKSQPSSNPERKRELLRRLRAKYPDRYRAHCQKRRALIAGVGGRGITEQDMQAMIYCQMGLCAYCERDGQKLTLDHIIPLDQKGLHDPDNACMCCGVCNSSKGNRTPDQWVNRWYLR